MQAIEETIASTRIEDHADCRLGYTWTGSEFYTAELNADGTLKIGQQYDAWGEGEEYFCRDCDITLTVSPEAACSVRP